MGFEKMKPRLDAAREREAREKIANAAIKRVRLALLAGEIVPHDAFKTMRKIQRIVEECENALEGNPFDAPKHVIDVEAVS